MTILELVAPHKDWREREKFWITYGRQFSWPLVNHMLMLDHRGAYIHVKVDDELYLQFRLMCLREGTTMTRKIDGMIRQVLVEYSRKELAAAREQQGGGEEE